MHPQVLLTRGKGHRLGECRYTNAFEVIGLEGGKDCITDPALRKGVKRVKFATQKIVAASASGSVYMRPRSNGQTAVRPALIWVLLDDIRICPCSAYAAESARALSGVFLPDWGV